MPLDDSAVLTTCLGATKFRFIVADTKAKKFVVAFLPCIEMRKVS